MAEKKAKLPIHQTPVGVAQYPNIVRPRAKYQQEDKFKAGVPGSGEYSVNLILSGADAAALAAKIDAAAEAALAEARANAKTKKEAAGLKPAPKGYKAELNDDAEETGNTIFRFKLPSTIKSKSGEIIKLRPAIFDAKGNPLTGKNLNVGGGSKIRVAFEMRPFAAPVGVGVSLQLKAVQIIELVEWNGERDATGYCFGKEDGFDASAMPLDEDAAPARTDEEAPSEAGDAGDEGDF